MRETESRMPGLRSLTVAAALYGIEGAAGSVALTYGAMHEGRIESGEVLFFGSWVLAFALYVFGSIALRSAVAHRHRWARRLGIARLVLAILALALAALGVAFLVMVSAGVALGRSAGTTFDDVIGWMLLTLPLVVFVGEIATVVGVVRYLRAPAPEPPLTSPSASATP